MASKKELQAELEQLRQQVTEEQPTQVPHQMSNVSPGVISELGMLSSIRSSGPVNTQSTLTPSSIPYSSTIAEQVELGHVQVPEDPLDSDYASTSNPTVPRSLGELEVSLDAIQSCFTLFVFCLQILLLQAKSCSGSMRDICHTSPYLKAGFVLTLVSHNVSFCFGR